MNVIELSGAQLDYWVARASGHTAKLDGDRAVIERVRMGVLDGAAKPWFVAWGAFSPSTNWADGGPIIEREGICISPHDRGQTWGAWITSSCYESNDPDARGATPLVAAMRAYVKTRFGAEVRACE